MPKSREVQSSWVNPTVSPEQPDPLLPRSAIFHQTLDVFPANPNAGRPNGKSAATQGGPNTRS